MRSANTDSRSIRATIWACVAAAYLAAGRLKGPEQRGVAAVNIETVGGNWVIIALMLTAAFIMGMSLLILNWIVAPSKPSWRKAAPYESGLPNVTPVQPRYTARFYVVAMLFVIFDIEAIFMFPWAVIFNDLGMYGFIEMLVFIALLFVGYIYAWRKGALEWV
jgi:NADH-quinone oxidoreductase subunit A